MEGVRENERVRENEESTLVSVKILEYNIVKPIYKYHPLKGSFAYVDKQFRNRNNINV